MPIRWNLADDFLLDLAKSIIRDHHPLLLEAQIGFMYRSEAQMSAGKTILGHTKKVSQDMQVFLDFDFVIWIAEGEFGRMEIDQQRALVDHELCHCAQDMNGNWIIRKHDFEEFYKIIERHGMWSQDSKYAGQAFKEAKQPSLIEFSSSRGGVATLTSEQLGRLAKGLANHQLPFSDQPKIDVKELKNNPEKLADLKIKLLQAAAELKKKHGSLTLSALKQELNIGNSMALEIMNILDLAGAEVNE